MDVNLTNPIFRDESLATAHMEADRWPKASIAPCVALSTCTAWAARHRPGMFLCNDCRGKFTVRTGTIFERSAISLCTSG